MGRRACWPQASSFEVPISVQTSTGDDVLVKLLLLWWQVFVVCGLPRRVAKGSSVPVVAHSKCMVSSVDRKQSPGVRS